MIRFTRFTIYNTISGYTRSLVLICITGSVVELYNKRGRPLPPDKVLQLFYQVCKSVQHMHNRQTPIIHRDMKVCVCMIYDVCSDYTQVYLYPPPTVS